MTTAVHSDDYPPFQLNRPRFDQSTFLGRYRHFLDVIDPRTLFTTKERLEECVKLLDDYKTGALPEGTTDKQLWEAQKIKQAIIHPDTGKKIFMPFRMSGNKIQWTQLVALYEWDKGTDRATPGLQLLPKLSYEHLHLTPGLRMKVSLAAQVMSSTIANALEVWKQPGLESTILFIRKVNKFFDCLNVSSVLEGKRKRNPDLMPFTSCDDPRLQWLEEDFLAFLKEWAEEGDKLEGLSPKEKQRLCMSQATVTGCHITGYVPFGTPTVVGLLLPNQTLGTTVFWQWLNQSHNACVNYSNRNATKETPTSRFMMGYVGAVSSACTIAVGLNVLISRSSALGPSAQMVIKRFIPFPAVALANICNVTLMRFSELWEGIEVMDENENVIGTSKVAAKSALIETAMTRVVLPAPILLLPPVIMTFIENKTTLIKKFPRIHFPLQVVVCTAAFAFALPIAISLFPQMAEMKVSKLEPEIQAATKGDVVLYNKGL